jgi:hypothetical protein
MAKSRILGESIRRLTDAEHQAASLSRVCDSNSFRFSRVQQQTEMIGVLSLLPSIRKSCNLLGFPLSLRWHF